MEWKGSKPAGSHHGMVLLQRGVVLVNNGTIKGGKIVIDLNTIRALDIAGTELEEKLVGH